MDKNRHKILTAYFSRAGKNYSNGSIVDLKIGNTALISEYISEITGSELFEIIPAVPYPDDYHDCTDAAQNELKSNSRPKLVQDKDISGYDIVFLGYPNWWGTMPMAVKTFLEEHDFKGKTVLPFCTHEGSSMGRSEADLKQLIPGAVIKRGLAIHGSAAREAKPLVKKWIEKEQIF